MAAAPPLKIYRNGEYVAAYHYPQDAAAICGMTAGTEVRFGHKTVIFREPEHDDDCPDWAACNSWDAAAARMEAEIERINSKRATP